MDAAVCLADPGRATWREVESLGEGWVAGEAVAIALFAALVASDFEHGARLAVTDGSDSDSTGSMTGQLLGTLLGVGAIPERRLAGLELHEAIERTASDLLVASLAAGPHLTT